MTLRDLLKKREKIKEDGEKSHPAAAEEETTPSQFTFMRSDTHTQEVISPPTFAEDHISEVSKDPHHQSKLFSRFRSASNASTASTVSSRTEKRLSSRLHLGSHSRSSSIGSTHLPSDLPAISDEVGEGEEKDAQWEKRATILAQGNLAARSRGNSESGSNLGHRPGTSRSISDAQGDVGKHHLILRNYKRPFKKQSGSTRQEVCVTVYMIDADPAIERSTLTDKPKIDLERSTAIFGRLAENNAMAQIMYGLALRHGWGIPPNPPLAITYLSQAASNAAAVESEALSSGMKKGGAAKGELVLAIYELANSFRHGWGVEKDAVAARGYYETAANLGDTDAMNEVAKCYEDGFGGKKDRFKAAKYYRLAEKNGNKTLGNTWIWKDKYSD
ncbi:MAG: hypothetical protein Q9220_003294 [cf. Caloplaca sp. 1 TL-2023]